MIDELILNFPAGTVRAGKDGCFVFSNDYAEISSPSEGYWQIAAGWEDETPAAWCGGGITEAAADGENGFILSGVVKLPQGECFCQDRGILKNGLLHITRRWEYHGEKLPHATLSLRFELDEKFPRIMMPGILYYGNPSGKTSKNVPLLPQKPGCKGFFEEHRFPVPLVSCECGSGALAALHTIPSAVPNGERADLWWSLGAEYGEEKCMIAAYSGFVSGNGIDGAVKATQSEWKKMPQACMTLTDGMIVEKQFMLQLAPPQKRGSAFIPALDAALDFWQIREISTDIPALIKSKYNYAVSRSIEFDGSWGTPIRPPQEIAPRVVYGWTGRNEIWCLTAPLLGKKFGDKNWQMREKNAFELLSGSPFSEGGFSVDFNVESMTWSTERNFVSQGQALECFSFALLEKRRKNEVIADSWMKFLNDGAEFFARRILADNWLPKSSNEAFLGAALVNAYKLSGQEKFRKAAIKLADHYIERHLEMDEPYWGGTLDARCEDKEGAAAGLSAFYSVWELTGEKRYLEAAAHAAWVIVSYLQMWEIPMPPGRLNDEKFNSVGWTAVSVQNMHLDVYGVWLAPQFYQLGKALNDERFCRIGHIMMVNCAQLTDDHGSQGEQIFQTNYTQQPGSTDLPIESLRGSYHESWRVFWMTAAFLDAAARFELMGKKILA